MNDDRQRRRLETWLFCTLGSRLASHSYLASPTDSACGVAGMWDTETSTASFVTRPR